MSSRVDADSQAGWNDFDFMLEMNYNYLSHYLAVVPFNELRSAQLALLASKGDGEQESYEDTPLRGRLYTYGPRQILDEMFRALNMSTLFEYHLIQHPTWLSHWENYQLRQAASFTTANTTTTPDNDPEVDEKVYLVVFMLTLTMPDGDVQFLELAQRDIPPGMDEEQALQQLIISRGAVDGDINSFTFDGYSTHMDIVTDIYAK